MWEENYLIEFLKLQVPIELFVNSDKNNDGKVTKQEASTNLRNYINETNDLPKEFYEKLVNGGITFSDFKSCLIIKRNCKQVISKLFK